MPDHYETLGVARSATAAEIKKAYRAKALEHHPDKPGGSDEAFQKLLEAYEVLKDVEKKHLYDNTPLSYSVQADLRRQTRVHRQNITITKDEGVSGTTKRVEIDGEQYEVSIPAGTTAGTKISIEISTRHVNAVVTVSIEGVGGLIPGSYMHMKDISTWVPIIIIEGGDNPSDNVYYFKPGLRQPENGMFYNEVINRDKLEEVPDDKLDKYIRDMGFMLSSISQLRRHARPDLDKMKTLLPDFDYENGTVKDFADTLYSQYYKDLGQPAPPRTERERFIQEIAALRSQLGQGGEGAGATYPFEPEPEPDNSEELEHLREENRRLNTKIQSQTEEIAALKSELDGEEGEMDDVAAATAAARDSPATANAAEVDPYPGAVFGGGSRKRRKSKKKKSKTRRKSKRR
jgi:hypothetical protein